MEPPVPKVVPEMNAEGECTGMLLSIPLRIPRSEVHQNGQGNLSVIGVEDGFAFVGAQVKQNFPANLSIPGTESDGGFAFGGTQQWPTETHHNGHLSVIEAEGMGGTQPNRDLPTTSLSVANDHVLQTTYSEAGTGSFPFDRTRQEPNQTTRYVSATQQLDLQQHLPTTHPVAYNRHIQTNQQLENLPTIFSVSNDQHIQTDHSATVNHQEPNQNLQTLATNGQWHHSEHATTYNGQTSNYPVSKTPQLHKQRQWNDSVEATSYNGQTSSDSPLPKPQPKKTHKCQQCGQQFQGNKQLVLHTRKAHYEGVQCPFCEAKFESGKQLKGHMSSEHASELPHVCMVCDERFRTAETLKNHFGQHGKRFGKGFIKRKKRMMQLHNRRTAHEHS